MLKYKHRFIVDDGKLYIFIKLTGIPGELVALQCRWKTFPQHEPLNPARRFMAVDDAIKWYEDEITAITEYNFKNKRKKSIQWAEKKIEKLKLWRLQKTPSPLPL